MNIQVLEIQTLKRQNTFLAAKVNQYKATYNSIKQKNEKMEISLANFQSVFTGFEDAWKKFLVNQHIIFNLIKSQANKSFINEHSSLYRQMQQILQNLSSKLKQNEVLGEEVNQNINKFVNNFQKFYNSTVQTYYDYYDKLNKMEKDIETADLQDKLKKLMISSIQKRNQINTIKEENIHAFKTSQFPPSPFKQIPYNFSQSLVKQNNLLKIKCQSLNRRLRNLSKYDFDNIEQTSNNDNYTCICGGNVVEIIRQKIVEEFKYEVKKQEIKNEAFVSQITQLENRNKQLREYTEKLKQDKKNRNHQFFKSNIFNDLINQAQQLLCYTTDISNRLNQTKKYVKQLQKQKMKQITALIEKHDQELKELGKQLIYKNRYDVLNNLQKQKIIILEEWNAIFKRQEQSFTKIINKEKEQDNTFNLYTASMQHQQKLFIEKQQLNKELKNLKQIINKKNSQISQLKANISSSIVKEFNFKHQKHKAFLKQLEQIIPEHFNQQFKDLVNYIKSRQAKLQIIRKDIVKKQSDLAKSDVSFKKLFQQLTIMQKCYSEKDQKYKNILEEMNSFRNQADKVTQQYLNIKLEIDFMKKQYQNIKNKIQTETQIKNILQKSINQNNQYLKQNQMLEIQVIQFHQNQAIIKQNFKLQNKLIEYQREITTLKIDLNLTQNTLKTIENSKKQLLEKNQQLKLELKLANDKARPQQEARYLALQLQQIKAKLNCSQCCKRQKEIKIDCGHIFCKQCVQRIYKGRQRFCPICKYKFDKKNTQKILFS